jgi:ABC-type multidrug transport system fused ATPase/permease subunit
MAELNSFSDNVVAFEAIKESDLLARTSAPRRDPLQPLFDQGSKNGGVLNETPIKHESLDVAPGNENRPPLLSPISLSRLQCAADSEEKEPLPRPVGLCHTSVPHGTFQVTVQGFTTECTLGECIPESVEGSYGNALRVDVTVGELAALAVDNFRQNTSFRQEERGSEFVNQLHTMPTYARTSSSLSSSKSHFEPYVPQHLYLQELFAKSSPDLLEAAMEKGVELLEKLKEPLTRAPSDDVSQWLPSIEKVQKQAVRAKTILGVVGNTGSGKSSIINAMLDEERLVPTNCMRACTAVVTEIS